jgi:hypothetical protein
MKLQVKLLVIVAAVLAIMLTLYYNSATFRYSSSKPSYPERASYDRRDRRRRRVNTPRKRRPSPEEVEKVYEKKFLRLPRFKRSGNSEDDYKDDRLSRDYIARERQFELPSQEEYRGSSTRPYNIGSTCNMGTDGEVDEYDGFSTFE